MAETHPSLVTATASPVAGGQKPALWKRAALWTTALVALGGMLYLTSGDPRRKDDGPKPAAPDGAGQIGSAFQPVTARTPPLPPAGPPPMPDRASAPVPMPTAAAYRPAPLMAFGGPVDNAARQPRTAGDAPAHPATSVQPSGDQDGLSQRLSSQDQPTAVAYRLPDDNLFLTEGTPVPCLPDAPITSDVEGAFRCKVQGAVFGSSGNVPLLDEGTWISGRVSSGIRRGQRRLFVVFTKIETPAPNKCMVRIRAPGADALGQAGLDGDIDRHFFERFGPYLAMAFVDAAMQGAVLAASNAVGRNRGLQFFQFQNAGRQGGRDAFAEDTQIPNTLGRGQAQPVVVRLTQDVDMRPCFRLRAKN